MISNSLFSINVIIFSLFLSLFYCFEFFSNDPDIDLNSTGLIESHGFDSQTHYVITKDGYILTLFRIINPFLTKRWKLYPIYIQYNLMGNTDQMLIQRHGFLAFNGSYIEDNGVVNDCSSMDSVAQSLPFVLSSCGYDVWLGNTRGSEYSSHLLLNQLKDNKYWSFSLDEMSGYDITANIHFILNATKAESIAFIGYSLGNALMFQLMSSQTQYSRLIKPFISLGSFVYLGSIRSPLLSLLDLLEPFFSSKAFRIGGLERLRPLFGRYFCGNSFLKEICITVYFLIGGIDWNNLDKSLIPRLWAHFPSGVSSTALAHIGQRIHFKTFKYYDYGSEKNMEFYGQTDSPNYNISNIDSKFLVLMSGLNDFLSDPIDNDILRSQLTVKPYLDYEIPYPYWTHGDFIYANSAGKYINGPILRILESLGLNELIDN